MQTYTTLRLGAFHPTFCDDFLASYNIDKQWFVAAVMDGCSSGKDSHFASTLFAKILSKIVNYLPYPQVAQIELSATSSLELLTHLSQQLFEEVKKIKNQLYLEVRELLSTLLLLVCNKEQKTAAVLVAGDGVVACNGKIEAIDQGDKPNYLAYHLDKKTADWFASETQIFEFKQVYDLSIATDGVTSFDTSPPSPTTPLNVEEYLLIDQTFSETETMLHKKCLYLTQEYGLQPNDDLAIVRLLL